MILEAVAVKAQKEEEKAHKQHEIQNWKNDKSALKEAAK